MLSSMEHPLRRQVSKLMTYWIGHSKVSSFHLLLEEWPEASIREKHSRRSKHYFLGDTPSLKFKVSPKGKAIHIKLKELEVDGLVPNIDINILWHLVDFDDPMSIPTKLGGYDRKPFVLKASFVSKGLVPSGPAINATKGFTFNCRSDEEMLAFLKEVERIVKPLYQEAETPHKRQERPAPASLEELAAPIGEVQARTKAAK